MSVHISEIAPDVYRLSVFIRDFNLQFNHFLVRDEEPLLYHTGLRATFPELRDAVARLLPLETLRWISFSHFESDECGALNDWLQAAPAATAVHGIVGTLVNLNDFALRPPRALAPGEGLETGRSRFEFHATPHLPHGWDAGSLFETRQKVLFCSDLFHQEGEREPLAGLEVLERTREAMTATQVGPLMDYAPYTHRTAPLLHGLAALQPATLAIMHGSSFAGDGAAALRELAPVMREVLGAPVEAAR